MLPLLLGAAEEVSDTVGVGLRLPVAVAVAVWDGNLVEVGVPLVAEVGLLVELTDVVGVTLMLAPQRRQIPLGGFVTWQPQFTQQSWESSQDPPSNPFGRQVPKTQLWPNGHWLFVVQASAVT